jgi:hypothetical protein
MNSKYLGEGALRASQGAREMIFMAVHQGAGSRLGIAWYDSATGEVGFIMGK